MSARTININVRELLREINNNPANYEIQPFTQSFNIGTINAGASTTVNSFIDASAAFIWIKTSAFATVAGAAQTDANRVLPLITVQLTDSGSQRNLMDQPQPIPLIAGAQGLPYLNQQPYLFQPNSNISGAFTNISTGTNYANTFLTLLGFRVYI